MTRARQSDRPQDAAEVTSWRGQAMYQCPACAYSTLERQKFDAHYAEQHTPPPVPDGFAPAETPPLETPAQE